MMFCFVHAQDELCLLSPAFAPSVFYVGKLSVDIPLAWNFSRPVKIAVSDVLALVRVSEHERMTPEVGEGIDHGCNWKYRSRLDVRTTPRVLVRTRGLEYRHTVPYAVIAHFNTRIPPESMYLWQPGAKQVFFVSQRDRTFSNWACLAGWIKVLPTVEMTF